MTSPHSPYMAQCDDTSTSREWLRSLAGNLALVSSWRVALGVLAHLLVHIADVVQYLRHGQTAVLSPSRTGNADHTLRAIMAGHAPMLFGGQTTTGAECTLRRRAPSRSPAIITWSVPRRRIMTAARGWYLTRHDQRRVLQ